MSIVCDNHNDRPAVATYVVMQTRVGERFEIGDFVAGVRHVDLCGECAAVLGWAPPSTEEPEHELDELDVLANEAQRRLIFACCREIGLDEDERHALLERVTGSQSTRDLLSKDVDRVVTALAEEEARRRAA